MTPAIRESLRKKISGMKLRLLKRDGPNCYSCHGEMDFFARNDDPWRASIDHIIPKSKGGSDKIDNLRLAHSLCNELRPETDCHVPEYVKVEARRIRIELRAESRMVRQQFWDYRASNGFAE